MDLKGIGKPIDPLPVTNRERVERSISSEKTSDREGNGQAAYDNQEKQHEPMTEEQFEQSLNHLRSLPVVKENHLEVIAEIKENKRIVILREPSGKVIRRIMESELWSLKNVKDSEKGQLLRRSA